MSYNLVFTKLDDLNNDKNSLLFIDYDCLNNIVDNYFDQNFKVAKPYGYENKDMENNFDLVGKFESYMDSVNVFDFGKFTLSTTTRTRY